MGRKTKRRAERWAIKTRPDLLGPKLEAVHDLSAEQIKRAYGTIDALYARVAGLLDDKGVASTLRAIYRAYAEELWKHASKYGGNSLVNAVFGSYGKYMLFGLSDEVLDEISGLVGVQTSSSELLTRLGGGVPVAHALLSATHTDTLAAAVVRGDLVVGNSTPKWSRLAKGSAGQLLSSDGTDVLWADPPVAGPPTAYNVFKLGQAYNSIVSGTWAMSYWSATWGCYFLLNTVPAIGDELQYKFSHKAGTFTFVMYSGVYDNRGIVTIYLDGVSQGTIDWYAAAGDGNIMKTLAISIATDGEHTLNIKVTGKNDNATNYYCQATAWWIRD